MSKARELASLGNAYSDGALSNRNVLINGSFTVSQRGDYTTATSISSGAYSVDRWKANDPFDLQHFTGQVIDGTRTNYIRMSYNGTQSMGIMQPVEDKNYDQLRGKTITISAYVRTNQAAFGFRIYDGSQNYGPRFNADGNWHRATWTFDWTATSPTSLLLLFDTYNNGSYPTVGSGDYVDIAMVQLEVGDTATPFEHRSYGQELALCQRYYRHYQSDSSTYMPFFQGGTVNSTLFRATFPLSPSMRTQPSLLTTGVASNYQISGTTNANCTSVPYLDAQSEPDVLDIAAPHGAVTGGQAFFLRAASSTTAFIGLDAEL